jgi:hemolysin III
MKESSAESGHPSLGEEIANSITHGVGAVLSIAGLVTLIVLGDNSNLSFIIYGVTLVLLYLASTLYHSLIFTRARTLFRKFDHMAIFLLIAGTYTPFCLMAVRGWVGWTVLGIIWGFAIVGIVMKSFFTGRYEWISITMYLLMGWMVIPVIQSIYAFLSFEGFLLLVAGGLAYTIGTIFYMNPRIPYHHGIWHLWVLAGSTLHFFSVLTLI